MEKLYNIINDNDNNEDLFLATIITKEFETKKILLSQDEIIFTDLEKESSNSIKEEINKHKDTKFIKYGENNIFIEKIGGNKTLVICGAGHVANPVIKLAKMIGLYVIIIDDRKEFVEKAVKLGADKAICSDFNTALNSINSTKDTYYVVITRGHSFDKECVQTVLNKPNAYIGMMGSKNKVNKIKNALIEEGFDKLKLEKVDAPIGIKINAEGPEEIAISIIAQIIAVKNTNRNSTIYDKAILDRLISKKDNEKCVLATIITKTGSTPRKVGTKMIVNSDKTIVGTIGGGVAESDAINESISLLEQSDKKCKILKANMYNDGTNGEDMICGGIIEILLEIV